MIHARIVVTAAQLFPVVVVILIREDSYFNFCIQRQEERLNALREAVVKEGSFRDDEYSLEERRNILHNTIKPILTHIIKPNQYFNIGVSTIHNVSNRTSEYYPIKDGWAKGYHELYQSNNPLNIASLEDDTIRFGWYTWGDFCCNNNHGGGGIGLEHPRWVLYLKLADRKPSPHWYAKNKLDSV